MEKDLQEIKATCCRPMAPSCGSSHKDNFDMNNVRDCESESDHEYDVPVENLPEGPVVCYLYVGNPRRHVGQGVLHNRPNEVLHGLLLPEGYARIQFEVAVESERHSKVPQATDEVSTVGDAVGHFISWPKELVSLKLECPPPRKMSKSSQKVTDNSSKPTEKTVESTVCAKPLGYPKYGDSPHDSMLLHILRLTPKNIVDNIEVSMNEYFGGKCWTENLAYENVLEILDDQRLSASSIAFYIRYLGEVHLFENIELAIKFSCVSPHISPLLGSGMTSNHLADCLLKYGGEDHLLLIPHNVGNHWVLVAINTKTEMIYFMDPSPNSKIAKHANLKTLLKVV